jgi:hypothetical protein
MMFFMGKMKSLFKYRVKIVVGLKDNNVYIITDTNKSGECFILYFYKMFQNLRMINKGF